MSFPLSEHVFQDLSVGDVNLREVPLDVANLCHIII